MVQHRSSSDPRPCPWCEEDYEEFFWRGKVERIEGDDDDYCETELGYWVHSRPVVVKQ